MRTTLPNREVVVMVSDPWQFGTECGTGPFVGDVVDETADTVVIAMRQSIDYQGKCLRTIVARPRHESDTVQALCVRAMPANLMLLPIEIRRASDLGPASTENGVMALGTVERSQ